MNKRFKKMATALERQLSQALVDVTEQRDVAKAGKSYAEDQLTLALAQNSALKGQVQLHEKAAAVRQSGSNMTTSQAYKNQSALFGSTKADNSIKNSGPSESTPERFDIN